MDVNEPFVLMKMLPFAISVLVIFKTSPAEAADPPPVTAWPFTVRFPLTFTFAEEMDRQDKSSVCGLSGIEPKAPHELLRIRPVAVMSTHCKFVPIMQVPVVVKFPWTSTALNA
jgi:hypothetical protein